MEAPESLLPHAATSRDTGCTICGNMRENKVHRAREMMFGTRDPFDYLECSACGTLQLVNPPADMSRYYPADYYSLNNQVSPRPPVWRRFLKRARGRYAIEGRGLLGYWVDRLQGHWAYYDWFRAAGLRLTSSILDVGCGRGDYLLRFASDGFTGLTGIDPYVSADINYGKGIHVYRRRLDQMTGTFDCVLARHSFEHMADPVTSLALIHALVAEGGVALIALPVAGCWAWKHYGINWFQLDAPRHLVIPSAKAMQLLARKVGFTLEKTIYDSTPEQTTASEAYQRDIPFVRYLKEGPASFLSADQLEAFKNQTAKLNAAGEGDQACFILRKRGEL